MKLADLVDRVVIDPRKLTDYALDPHSPWGQYKAVVFRRRLGYTREDYADLLVQIEEQVLEADATLHSEDELGQRYAVDLVIRGTEGRQAIVRTGWFVPHGANEARLVTLYVRR